MKLLISTIAILTLTLQSALADLAAGIAAQKAGDYDTAFKEISAEAEKGDAEAQFLLSNLYFDAHGTPRDRKKGVEWLTKSAEQDHHDAQFALGVLYSNGAYIDKDAVKAFEWSLKAANNGNLMAHYTVGTFYMQGSGTAVNAPLGIEWHRKGASMGLAESQYILGLSHENGVGVEKNLDEALIWYKQAAKNGSALAIGNLLKLGITVSLDPSIASNQMVGRAELALFKGDNETAIAEYEEAAEMNNLIAQYQLGQIYSNGVRIKQDYVKSYNYFLAAAKNGDSQAQYKLSRMHVSGLGVPQSIIQAAAWLIIANQSAPGIDGGSLKILSDAMTPEQITEAELIATNWYNTYINKQ